MRSFRLPLGCLVAAALGLGCSSPTTVASTTTTQAPVPDALAFVDDGPEVLRIALAGPSGSIPEMFDPVSVSLRDQGSVVVADLLFDGLTEVVGRSSSLRPALALSWDSTQDSRSWTFTLDAERTDAATVKRSLERLVAERGVAGAMLGDVVGVNAFVGGTEVEVEGFEVIDESTLVILLDKANAGLPWILSGLAFSVAGDDLDPSGRYEIASSTSAVLRLEETSTDAAVIEIVWEESDTTRRELLGGGDVDVAWVDLSAEPDEAGGVLPGVRVGDAVPLGSSRFFVLNGASDQFEDGLKREAVLAAVDPQALASVAGLDFEDDGSGRVGVSAEALAGNESGACLWCEVGVERQRDLAQVMPTIEPLLIGHLGGIQEEVAEVLAQRLRDVGLTVEVQKFDPNTLAAAVGRGSVDLFGFGWTAPAGSLDASVAQLFGSGSQTNVFGIAWGEVDELLELASVEPDDVARWQLLRAAETEALSQFVAIPYGAETSQLAGVQAVRGLVVRADGSLDVDGLQ